MQELLAEARSLEETVSSELSEVVVFLELLEGDLLLEWVLEQASLKQLEIFRMGAPERDKLLPPGSLISASVRSVAAI